MKKILIGTAVVATLTLSSLCARAGCVDPRSPNQQTTPFDLELGSMPSRAARSRNCWSSGPVPAITKYAFGRCANTAAATSMNNEKFF